MAYATEREARLHYLSDLLRLCGTTEGSEMHKALLHLYNQIDPLPRGHRAVVSDDWCAIFQSAIAHSLGYRGWPFECSCSMIIQQATAQGRWHRAGAYIPQMGDWILYDWGPNGKVDHVGAVCWIEGSYLWIIEGNYGDSVKVRRIESGNAQIYGYVALDFSELVEPSSETVTALRPGDSGEAVLLLQFVLKGAGYYYGAPDGSYDEKTAAAVMDFQLLNGLEVDGKAGPKTQGKLRSGDFVIMPIADEEVEAMEDNRYQTVDELPEWAKPTISKLAKLGWLQGDGAGLDLSYDMVRMLVVNDRAGLYDGKIAQLD